MMASFQVQGADVLVTTKRDSVYGRTQIAWRLALSAHPAVESGILYRDLILDWRLM